MLDIMDTVIYLFRETIVILIDVLHIAMLVRAILSWFDPMQEGRIAIFLHALTEPVILPIRALCARHHWFEGFPMDIPFLLTWLALTMIQVLVSTL